VTRLVAFGLAAALVLSTGPAPADNSEPPPCAAPAALTRIEPILARAAARIEHTKALTIVAVGSSSTLGVGASAPSFSYPSRLEADLRDHLPGVEIHVINRGKGGEDAAEELERLGRDVIAEHPDLVVWQVGTNAVLRRDDLEMDEVLLRRGVSLLKQSGADVVLMDMQYAPRVVERRSYAAMEQLIAEIAHHTGVGLFRRFAVMQHWHAARQPESPRMIGADGLHMTDVGYGCLAAELAKALSENWEAHRRTAQHAGDTAAKLADMNRAGAVPISEIGAY
jgi:lysophospholipase L1-like esterase